MKEKDHEEFEELFQSLHKQKNSEGHLLVQYQGFWYDKDLLKGIKTCQKHFQANDTDIILATMPKSGTTWLKALTFAIVNRSKHSVHQSPLLFSNPHQLIPFLETNLYKSGEIDPEKINSIPSPRIFATHVPYHCIPNTILDHSSNVRIIYLCRNLLDAFTSLLHYAMQNGYAHAPQLPQSSMAAALDGYVKTFCDGIHRFGPSCDQILGYWEANLANPQKVLFLKFEDLKRDINNSVKNIANFLGCPFSAEEEKDGLVEKIAKLCSLENLKNLECNKKGETQIRFNAQNSSFFRKGEVGDWVNLLTPSMAERLQKLMEEKLSQRGLNLEIN